MTDPDGDGHFDCIPAVDNFQIISGDEGRSWGKVSNISAYLGDSRGLLPGPGTGAYIEQEDRIVMAGHYLTAERENGRVVMYYSDDGGLTWSLSPSGRFPRADEAMVTHTGGTNLTVNLRRDVTECEVCPPKVSLIIIKSGLDSWYCQAGACNCRGRAFSNDNGLTWTEMDLGGCS